jgi:hypothetical protein
MPGRTLSMPASAAHAAGTTGGSGAPDKQHDSSWGDSISAQLSSLTNLNDINRLLHETIAFERAIEAELDKQLGRKGELERSILQLNATTSEVCLALSWGVGEVLLSSMSEWPCFLWQAMQQHAERRTSSPSHTHARTTHTRPRAAGTPNNTQQLLDLIRTDAEQLFRSVQATAATADRIGSRVRRLDQQQGNVTDTLDLISLILDRTHCVSGVQQAMAAHDYDTAAQHIATFLQLEQRLSPTVAGVDAGQVEEQRQVSGGVRCARGLEAKGG